MVRRSLHGPRLLPLRERVAIDAVGAPRIDLAVRPEHARHARGRRATGVRIGGGHVGGYGVPPDGPISAVGLLHIERDQALREHAVRAHLAGLIKSELRARLPHPQVVGGDAAQSVTLSEACGALRRAVLPRAEAVRRRLRAGEAREVRDGVLGTVHERADLAHVAIDGLAVVVVGLRGKVRHAVASEPHLVVALGEPLGIEVEGLGELPPTGVARELFEDARVARGDVVAARLGAAHAGGGVRICHHVVVAAHVHLGAHGRTAGHRAVHQGREAQPRPAGEHPRVRAAAVSGGPRGAAQPAMSALRGHFSRRAIQRGDSSAMRMYRAGAAARAKTSSRQRRAISGRRRTR